ncbi:YlbF family regulator [Peptococcaceae bacterium]|nr:YlbF family regulator [Peptococcaceae bacterium]
MSDSIVVLAEKLGQALAKTEEFKLKSESEFALRSNPDANNAVKEFQTLKKSFLRMEKMGHMLSDKNNAQLKKAEEVAMQNLLVKDWYEKSQNFYDFVIAVNTKMQEGIVVNNDK